MQFHGRGEIRQHRRVRPLQMKHHGRRIGRVDAGDGGVVGLADRKDALRRVDDAIVARLHVGGGERRPVVKQHVAAQLEGVGSPVGRDAPGFSEVADDLRIIGRVEFEQCRVVRNNRMNEDEGEVGMTVVVRRLGIDCERQNAAALRGEARRWPCRETLEKWRKRQKSPSGKSRA